MEKLNTFFKETYQELVNKVTWPTWEELQSSAMVVAVAAIIIALVVFGMDKATELLLDTYYQL